jgi:hypothetical protein
VSVSSPCALLAGDAGQTGKDVAALYGISPSLVSLIVRRKKWAHVP